jgi:hypothetical protein
MRWHGHGYGALARHTVLLVATSCGQEGDVHDLHDLPPISWRGSHIEFGSDVDEVVCPATLPAENEYMEGVDEYVRSNSAYPVQYYRLREDWAHYGFGCEGAHGCIRTDIGLVVIGSRLLSHRHELIHASSIGPEHRLLEEGLATFLGTDLKWAGIADPLDIRTAFESIDGNGRGLPDELYPVAGHFISFLVEEHGLANIVSLVQASDLALTSDELSTLFVEHLGRDLASAIDDYEASGPGCEVAQYSPTWFQCELTPPSIPIFACDAEGWITIDVPITCADGASGVQDGLVWRDVLVDAPADELVVVGLEDGHPVEVVARACGHGCSTPFARFSSETAEQFPLLHAIELRQGLNLLRISKSVQTQGRVRLYMTPSCP